MNAGPTQHLTVEDVNPDDGIRIGTGLFLPAAAIEWRFDRAGGPGGQHRNKVHTRVTARVDLNLLQGPHPCVERVKSRIGTSLAISEGTSRSQWRNRARAVERIRDTLEKAARPARLRHATRPTRSAVERRLKVKRRVSQRKRERGSRRSDEQ